VQILNIAAYKFAAIDKPADTAGQLRLQAEQHGLLGTVLVAPEGVNMFLAGNADAVRSFLLQACSGAPLSGLRIKQSWSEHVPFRRLKVRVEREIITFDPSIDPATQAAPGVDPATLRRWLDDGHDDAGRPVVLLDTRNEEEIALGTFDGALNPHIKKFTELPAAIDDLRDALQDKTVVAFCTGGVRCEKAVPWLRAHGIAHSVQLEGGILGYFEAVGGAHWQGRCFVFDERVALDPELKPLVDQPAVGRV
jgi:UPF0176 protein